MPQHGKVWWWCGGIKIYCSPAAGETGPAVVAVRTEPVVVG